VLTTEFIDGCKVSDVKAIADMGLSLKDVDYKLVNCFSHQVFHSGFVHADPHPGNSECVLVSKYCIVILM
jgi:aarF domain-containing kinase